MKIIVALFLLVNAFAVFAEDNNTNGFGDTSKIVGLNANTKYSKPFLLSAFESCRFDVMANDTQIAGLSADSVCFAWWFETGHQVMNASNKLDTEWARMDPVYVDSFNTTVAANFVPAMRTVDTNFIPTRARKTIDSSSVTGYNVQSRWIPFCEWDQYVRLGFKAGSDNRTAQPPKIICAQIRQLYIHTRMR
jgi:hypothetical protein